MPHALKSSNLLGTASVAALVALAARIIIIRDNGVRADHAHLLSLFVHGELLAELDTYSSSKHKLEAVRRKVGFYSLGTNRNGSVLGMCSGCLAFDIEVADRTVNLRINGKHLRAVFRSKRDTIGLQNFLLDNLTDSRYDCLTLIRLEACTRSNTLCQLVIVEFVVNYYLRKKGV